MAIPDFPMRACPYYDCQAIWLEDTQMYDDVDVCPTCGRNVSDFDRGEVPDLLDGLPIGSGKTRQIIYTETAGPLLQENGGFIVTEQTE